MIGWIVSHWSCWGLTQASIVLRKGLDRRVKPRNDSRIGRTLRSLFARTGAVLIISGSPALATEIPLSERKSGY